MIRKDSSSQDSTAIVCFRCGICCTDFQPRLTLPEAHGIADRLGENWHGFMRKYIDGRWPFAESLLLRHATGACVFLSRSEGNAVGLCRIEEFKPECCRQWQAGLDRKECQRGLSKFWNLTVNEVGELVGLPESIQRFKKFLESLG
jgi:Fe-S-cluster containining protein